MSLFDKPVPALQDNPPLKRLRTSSPRVPPAQPLSQTLGETAPKYRRNWKSVPHTRYGASQKEWTDFYNFWWGPDSSGKAILDAAHNTQDLSHRVLRINQPALWYRLNVLSQSAGRLLVIPAYESLYDRLDLAHHYYQPLRIILSGQRGIGKTYFIIYALLRRMVKAKPVLFTTSTGETYLFDEFGIAFKRKKSVTLDDLPPFDHVISHSRAWSLVDANTKGKPEESDVTRDGVLFSVLATSPHQTRYKHWSERSRVFIMDPWTAEELYALLNLKLMVPALTAQVTLDGVKRAMAEAGPCPHDLLLYSTNMNRWESELLQGLESLASLQMVVDTAGQAWTTMDSNSQLLFLVHRSKSGPLLQSDISAISLKSPFIALKIQQHFRYLHIKGANQIFEAPRTFSHASIFAGWAFDALVTGYLSRQQTGADAIFCQLVPMTPIAGVSNHFHHFQDEETTLSAFIEVDGDSGDVKYITDDVVSYGLDSQQTRRSLPLYHRAVAHYHDITSLQPDCLRYYVPFSRINPFFDSFFLEMSPLGVIIWVFRVTVAREQGGSFAGMDRLQDLIETIKLKTTNIEVKYVLVAPHRLGEGVKWKMPRNWESMKGEVFVQYVDFSAFPACRYEDVFNNLPY